MLLAANFNFYFFFLSVGTAISVPIIIIPFVVWLLEEGPTKTKRVVSFVYVALLVAALISIPFMYRRMVIVKAESKFIEKYYPSASRRHGMRYYSPSFDEFEEKLDLYKTAIKEGRQWEFLEPYMD